MKKRRTYVDLSAEVFTIPVKKWCQFLNWHHFFPNFSRAPASSLRDGLALQRKGAVESRRSDAADDVRANPEPIRVEVTVADPHLQVPRELRVRR